MRDLHSAVRPLIRNLIRPLVLASAAVAFSATAHAQLSAPAETTHTEVHDATALRPPVGARVAIVEFEDMECPQCARQNPVLKAAAAQYHIPWIRHDFPLQQHVWSFQAAVNARWFDTRSKKLGDEYRDAVFAAQPNIESLDDLNGFTQKFATDHSVALPFVMDPQKKLAAEVKADYALGQRIGLDHTPTIWIVTNGANGAPAYSEVVNYDRLYPMIDNALAETRSATPRTTASARR